MATRIIAEIGVNHFDIAKQQGISPMESAKRMIAEAARAGADVVKFQSYKASTIAAKDSPAYWDTNEEPTQSQYELFTKFDSFGPDEYRKLAGFCSEAGIEFLSTPFDLEAVRFLEPLVSFYKVASADLTNYPLLKAIARTGKPIVMSVGASTMDEIAQSLSFIRSIEPEVRITLLHCILNYPTRNENANLKRIPKLIERFPECTIGYSDHTLPDDAMVIVTAAAALGAQVIEKHFTLDKTLPGNDHYHAMDPSDLRRFRNNLGILDDAMSKDVADYLESEEVSRTNARRSIVTIRALPKGTVLEQGHLIMKRPGSGISPKDLDRVIGRTLTRDVGDDTILSWDDFE
jgi:sialic acid synthase SpsE